MIDRVLRSGGTDPFANLALEESLLERGFGGGSALLLYVNAPCAVVGRNQNPWAEVSARAFLDGNAPVLRRVSGGGAVYQDVGNLNWSFIVPRPRHDREAELDLIVGALREFGIELAPGKRGALLVAGEGPYRGAKVSGTARRLQAERVLHHGTLLIDADLTRLSSSLGGIEVAASRALASAPSACANLSSLVPGLGLQTVAEALARELAGREAESAEFIADKAYAEEASARLRSWEWTWGATPPFSISLDWSGGRALLDLRQGRVASVSGPGSASIDRFIGRPFEYGMPVEFVKAMEVLNV